MTPPKKQRKQRASYAQRVAALNIRLTSKVYATLQSLAAIKCTTKTDLIEALIMAASEQLGIQEIMELETQKKGIQARINELTDRITNKNQF